LSSGRSSRSAGHRWCRVCRIVRLYGPLAGRFPYLDKFRAGGSLASRRQLNRRDNRISSEYKAKSIPSGIAYHGSTSGDFFFGLRWRRGHGRLSRRRPASCPLFNLLLLDRRWRDRNGYPLRFRSSSARKCFALSAGKSTRENRLVENSLGQYPIISRQELLAFPNQFSL
jgi:hypothetical protein